MLRNTLRAALLAAVGIVLALPLQAQSSIGLGQTVHGSLISSDPKAEDDTYFDTWTYAGSAGERIVIKLRSEDFDAFLVWGQTTGGDWHPIESDDDGDGRTDARLVVTPGRSGTYSIRVKTLRAGETGRYTLSVEPVSPESLSPRVVIEEAFAGSVSPGRPGRGRLLPSDTRQSYDAWTYDGTAGEVLLITLRSSEFDAYLDVGEGFRSFTSLKTDDNGGGGTDARVEITLPRTGSYIIRAKTLVARAKGAYTLSMERRYPAERLDYSAAIAALSRLTPPPDTTRRARAFYIHFDSAGRPDTIRAAFPFVVDSTFAARVRDALQPALRVGPPVEPFDVTVVVNTGPDASLTPTVFIGRQARVANQTRAYNQLQRAMRQLRERDTLLFGRQFTVHVRMIANVDSTATSASVTRSSDVPAIDSAALDVASTLRFSPGEVDGVPTPTWVTQPFTSSFPRRPRPRGDVACGGRQLAPPRRSSEDVPLFEGGQ